MVGKGVPWRSCEIMNCWTGVVKPPSNPTQLSFPLPSTLSQLWRDIQSGGEGKKEQKKRTERELGGWGFPCLDLAGSSYINTADWSQAVRVLLYTGSVYSVMERNMCSAQTSVQLAQKT